MSGLTLVTLIARAFAEIGKIALDANHKNAADAVMVIRAIYLAAIKADRGEIAADAASREIDKLIGALRENDKAADAALEAKFGKG